MTGTFLQKEHVKVRQAIDLRADEHRRTCPYHTFPAWSTALILSDPPRVRDEMGAAAWCYACFRRMADLLPEGHLFVTFSAFNGETQHDDLQTLLTAAQLPFFRGQLRAALRLSAKMRVSLVLPSSSSVEEVRAARRLLEIMMRTLLMEHEPFDETVECGVLFEAPAMVLGGRAMIEETDFAVFDADMLCRTSVAGAARPLSPEEKLGFLRLLSMGIGNTHAVGRFACVAGRIAGESQLLEEYLAMGADMLAVPPDVRLSSHRTKEH